MHGRLLAGKMPENKIMNVLSKMFVYTILIQEMRLRKLLKQICIEHRVFCDKTINARFFLPHQT